MVVVGEPNLPTRPWQIFQIKIRPEAFDALQDEALRARRGVREHAAFLLEEILLREAGALEAIRLRDLAVR